MTKYIDNINILWNKSSYLTVGSKPEMRFFFDLISIILGVSVYTLCKHSILKSLLVFPFSYFLLKFHLFKKCFNVSISNQIENLTSFQNEINSKFVFPDLITCYNTNKKHTIYLISMVADLRHVIFSHFRHNNAKKRKCNNAKM